jgi:hypothetical protein
MKQKLILEIMFWIPKVTLQTTQCVEEQGSNIHHHTLVSGIEGRQGEKEARQLIYEPCGPPQGSQVLILNKFIGHKQSCIL